MAQSELKAAETDQMSSRRSRWRKLLLYAVFPVAVLVLNRLRSRVGLTPIASPGVGLAFVVWVTIGKTFFDAKTTEHFRIFTDAQACRYLISAGVASALIGWAMLQFPSGGFGHFFVVSILTGAALTLPPRFFLNPQPTSNEGTAFAIIFATCTFITACLLLPFHSDQATQAREWIDALMMDTRLIYSSYF